MGKPRRESVDRPMSWEEAASVIAAGRTDLMYRQVGGEEHYTRQKEKLVARYSTVTDAVLITKLGYDAVADGEGKLEARRPSGEEDASSSGRVAYVRNDFGYSFEEPIEHWLLWAERQMTAAEVARETEKQHPEAEYERLMFLNPPMLRTIGAIHHWHVLVRPRHQPQPR